uniref:Ig-like domain-containing protein n=1 Tax=Oncorhynchus mykiss TaxID=8022 RepID=A0A8C7UCP0_ONCMY
MQENNVNQPTSLSQLLRENYLAEARSHQRHSGMSRSDSLRHLVYVPLKGKAEDSAGQDKPQPQFPDLSAFLSQEELDKSVNLACQAIGHEACEERTEFKVPVTPSVTSTASNTPDTQEAFEDFKRPGARGMNTPEYGLGTQSKKEFLNKAADFIEELSSLFKTNSSKRIQPRSCKTHRSRANKGQVDGSVYSLNADNRERTILLQDFETEMERPTNPFSIQPSEVQGLGMDPGFGHAYFPMQDWRTTEEQYDEAESPALVEITPGVYTADPICEPPHFIQKLKGREVLEGSKVQLDCIVRGLPMPEVRWFCEGKELENCPDIQIINNGELHSLTIAEAFEEDTGRYSCFASNFYGTGSTSAEIYVEVKTVSVPLELMKSFCFQNLNGDSYTLSPDIYPQGLDGRPIMAAPVFTKSLQDLLASESELVVLECRVKGVPSPKVDWYREGTVMEDSPDFRILQKKPRSMDESEEICTLVIAEVFPEDSGKFTCTASNKYGTVSSIAALRVKGNHHPPGSLQLQQFTTGTCEHQYPPSRPSELQHAAPGPGVLVNHNGPRSRSRAGLRVHFKLPEDETENQSEASNSHSYEDMSQLANKEPPPVLAKPKLDPVQLQLLHNQVLMEQQQTETEPNGNTSPTPLLRTTHASLLNLAPTSQSFNYARPKEFITAQTPLSPFRSPSPTESPVPLLHKLAAELNSSNPNQFSPQPRVLPTRVLKSPTSPPSFMSSPTSLTMLPAAYLNSVFALPQQSPPQAASPTSSTSSPIQNHVAFLSSVLPSLHTTQATNSMGLPRSAHRPPQGILKKLPTSTRPILDDDIRSSQQTLLHDIEKKLRFNEDLMRGHVQQEYKVSNFEQRLMSEIEFRLERTPVEESDDEVQHDEIPTGKCIAPMFGKKLKNFRAMEGVPMTFSCKVVGIPVPKVYWFKDGKQILRKNYHYKKIREGDGTCALHIEVTNNDDDGNYTVLAANPQGRISCSGHLIIQTGPLRNRMTPMIHSQRVQARIQEVEEGELTQERFFQPHFLQAPGDMVAHEGRVCRLDCKVSGLPNPELMWLINGRPIYPNFYHRMLVRENGIHSLVIDPLKQDDAGTYTCIASNKAGQSSFGLELRVVEKEMKQVPQFVEKLQNTGIAEGTPVRLECRVLGMPPPVIYWKKDNDTIPHTKARVSLHQDATGYVFLLIQPTRKEDAGWYTVSAKNEAGIVSCTARLDIYAQWHQHDPLRYAALTGQGLDIKSAFPTTDNSPILFSSSPMETQLESDEL